MNIDHLIKEELELKKQLSTAKTFSKKYPLVIKIREIKNKIKKIRDEGTK